jgi:probable HAF family extracellular repeat protein
MTTDGGAIVTRPVWAQPSSPNAPVDLTPIHWYAEFIHPNGDPLRIGLATPDFVDSSASAVNDLGQAVGQSSGPSGISHAFLFKPGIPTT